MKVPFNKISVTGSEISNIEKAIESGHLQGDGKFLRSAESKLRGLLGNDTALVTNSCTSALETAAFLCDIKPGDEVVVPTYTFVTSISSFVLRGAKPVFCDINEETLNMDEKALEGLVGPRTKVIVPVHYAGVSCDMDYISNFAGKRGIKVVEDAAQGFMASYKGVPLGTLGDFGAISFHGTKNVICGEGGAIVMKDRSFFDRANFIREKGTNRIHFVEGKIDKYTWVDYGSSYIPSELCAAFLDAQLDFAVGLTEARVAAWKYYFDRLSPLEKEGRIKLPKVPKNCSHNAHIFFIIASSEGEKEALSNHLKRLGVATASHYSPLHLSPMAKSLGCPGSPLPVAERVTKTMLRLPIFSSITSEELDYVCDGIFKFYSK